MTKFIELTSEGEKFIVNTDYIETIEEKIEVKDVNICPMYPDFPEYVKKEFRFALVLFHGDDKPVIVEESYEEVKKKLMDATAEPSKETKEGKNNE